MGAVNSKVGFQCRSSALTDCPMHRLRQPRLGQRAQDGEHACRHRCLLGACRRRPFKLLTHLQMVRRWVKKHTGVHSVRVAVALVVATLCTHRPGRTILRRISLIMSGIAFMRAHLGYNSAAPTCRRQPR